MGIARCVVVVVVDGPPQMGDGQDSAQSIHSQTGYSPGAPKKQPREAPKVAKSDESSLMFALFNPKVMPVSSEIGKSYQSI